MREVDSGASGIWCHVTILTTRAVPTAPCKLPNANLADPPLKMGIAHTLEFGARGRIDSVTWSAAAYRTELTDDIKAIVVDAFSQQVATLRQLTSDNRAAINCRTYPWFMF